MANEHYRSEFFLLLELTDGQHYSARGLPLFYCVGRIAVSTGVSPVQEAGPKETWTDTALHA